MQFGAPERLGLVLEALHPVAEKTGLLRLALGINENRQIPAQPHRVHRFKKERAMAAYQVLDIMLRRHDQHVHAGVVHQPVEASGVERGNVLFFGDVEHGRSPCGALKYHLSKSERADEPDWPAGRIELRADRRTRNSLHCHNSALASREPLTSASSF